MASSLIDAARLPLYRRVLVPLVAAGGLALTPLPASAEPQPGTSTEAASLIAARAHDLEVLTEQFNAAGEELKATQEKAAEAAADLTAAVAALAQARDHVRAVAYGAYTGGGLSPFEAMLTSDSPDELLDRVGTLQTIAAHNNGALDTADRANHDADRAKATAEQVAADAQAQVERLAAQKEDLDNQIAAYQADYDRLNAEEQRASRAAAERQAADAQAAAEQAATTPDASSDQGSGPAPAAPPAPPAPAAPPAPPAPAAPPAPPATAAAVSGGSSAAQTAVDTAMAQLGDPYVWAAAGPDAFDCSGLVQYAYAAAGIQLPHSSSMQSTMGSPVSRSALVPGDLVFFYSPVSHVGIYIGNGQMVHASTSGEPVKTASVDSMPSYNSARRIAG
jgi:peptidoglycan DL-endopeptidase CwlO